jgi:hypothetical protein
MRIFVEALNFKIKNGCILVVKPRTCLQMYMGNVTLLRPVLALHKAQLYVTGGVHLKVTPVSPS